MKKTLLTFVLSIISFMVFAQLATIGTEWYYGVEFESPPGVESYFKYVCEKDTVIDNETYSIIQSYRKFNERICIKQDSSKVYYYLDGKKNLFFDFSAKTGDTILVDLLTFNGVVSHQISKSKIVVQDILFIKNNAMNVNDSVRSFRVSGLTNGFLNYTFSEKLLNTSPDYSLVSLSISGSLAYTNYLRCYISDGYTFHSSARFNSERTCDYQNVLINEIKALELIKVYPNPANSSLFIENENQSKLNGISICNALGELVFQKKLTEPQRLFQMDISEVPSGIYIIQLNNEDSTKTLKFIKQ